MAIKSLVEWGMKLECRKARFDFLPLLRCAKCHLCLAGLKCVHADWVGMGRATGCDLVSEVAGNLEMDASPCPTPTKPFQVSRREDV